MFCKPDLKNRFSQWDCIPSGELPDHSSATGCGGSGTPPSVATPAHLVSEKCIQALPLPCSEWDVGICADKDVANQTEKSFSFALLHSVSVLALRNHGVCDLHV